jgi:hypothetical protein
MDTARSSDSAVIVADVAGGERNNAVAVVVCMGL